MAVVLRWASGRRFRRCVCVCLLVRVARRSLQACMVVVRLLGASCGPKDRFGNRTQDSLNGALGGANVLCIGRCGVMAHCNERNCQLRSLYSPIEPCLHPARAVHWIRSLPFIDVMCASSFIARLRVKRMLGWFVLVSTRGVSDQSSTIPAQRDMANQLTNQS